MKKRKGYKLKKIIYVLVLILFFTNQIFSQLYQGPAQGSVASGVAVTMTGLSDDMPGEPLPPYLVKGEYNESAPAPYPDFMNNIKPTGPEGSNFVFDKSTIGEFDSPSILLKNFPGVPRTPFLPPDPSMAAGPTHVIGGVNSTFRVWDKEGNVVTTISAATWLSSLGAGIGAAVSDPKVVYDHFSKRWIMVWITPPIGPVSYDVVSVSDDSIPTGTWYNYAMRNDLNGTTSSGIWRDYEGVGYDANAVYITGNGFTISGSQFTYSKMRIINKSQLYANTGGSVTWYDIWDIRDPTNFQTNFGIRPAITYGNPSEYNLLCNSPFTTGTFVTLYKLVNPLNSPSMTAVNIPVTQYSTPPSSLQLNSTFSITAGGTSGFRNEPVYKNGYLHGVQAVRNGNFSAFKYYKINTSTNVADEDVVYGATDFYYSYPAVSVDKNENVIVSFSRSGLTEYIGAYYTTRTSLDPPNTFNPASPLQPGKGTINNTGSANRWGDYMGSWTDPVGEEDFWILTEYADLNNNWGVWVGNVRVSPYSAATLVTSTDTLNYGNIEVNTASDTQSVKIVNFGSTTLSISNIQVSNSEFQIINPPALPVNIPFSDSITLNVWFKPVSPGVKYDSLVLTSNDATSPNTSVFLKGNGYVINAAQANVIYGVTGVQSGGILLTVNPGSGVGSSVGPSGFSQLNGLSVRPSNNQLYATITSSPVTQLVRVNASAGDAYTVPPIPIANIRSLAFDLDDVLYCSGTDGKLYKYDVTTGDTTLVGSTGISNLYGMSINPVNRSLWGINISGAVYKIDKQTAVSQSVGTTGQSTNADIAFSKTGVLYGLSGIGNAVNKLLMIDTTNGTSTIIGTDLGFAGTNGLAISPDIMGIQNITTTLPGKYELYQNYPNPFNPVTNIKFDIPKGSNVRLTVYDMLGKEITKLVNEKLEAGSYSYQWNGVSLSSGVYFYRIETDDFFTTRRMVLIK